MVASKSFKLTAKVMGKKAIEVEAEKGDTVGAVLAFLGLEGAYTMNVSGEPANADTKVKEGDFVVFAPSVKGA